MMNPSQPTSILTVENVSQHPLKRTGIQLQGMQELHGNQVDIGKVLWPLKTTTLLGTFREGSTERLLDLPGLLL